MHPVRVLAVVAAVLTGLTGLVGCGGDQPAAFNDADVTFASEMVSHHEQAVEMAAMAAGRPLTSEVRTLVDSISETQQDEITTMWSWLDAWGKPAPDRDPDAAMDMGGAMDGMMSKDQMKDLAATPDADFQQEWLTLMIAHHEGALEMASTEAATGRFPAAVSLAREIKTTQTAEIAEMRTLLGR